jgi:hypothetical protein
MENGVQLPLCTLATSSRSIVNIVPTR